MIEKEGIIVSVVDYKEKDGLVYFATPQGIQTLYARGIQTSTSKNKRLCNPFSRVRLTLEHKEGRQMDILIRGELLDYFYEIQEDLVAQSICFVLRDCLTRLKSDEICYQYWLACWQSFQGKSDEAIAYACLTLAHALQLEGIEPYVDGCIRCHSKSKIETVSMKDGGFLCSDCNHVQVPWSKEDLKKFRGLFIVKPEVIEAFCTVYSFTISDFIYLARWFEHYEHVQLASIEFLQSIQRL